MSCRFADRTRAVALVALLVLLAVGGIEAAHRSHHDGGGLVAAGCATCVAMQAPLMAAASCARVSCGLAPVEWCDSHEWRKPDRGAIRAAGSRAPPAVV